MAIVDTIRAWNALILLVDEAPTISGVKAGIDSIAINSNGVIYQKTGSLDTDWTLVVTPSGGTSPVVEYRSLTASEALNESLELSYLPTDPNLVQLDAIGGTAQEYGFDYQVVSQTLSWAGLDLSGELVEGSKVRISYFKF